MKLPSPFRTAPLFRLGIALLCPVFILQATARAAETEVFTTRAPENEKKRSGFDEKAAVRIEPSDGKSLRLNLRDLPAHQFLKVQAEIEIQAAPGMEIEFLMMGDGREFDPVTIKRSRLQIKVDGRNPTVDSSFAGYMGVGGSFPDFDGEFLHLPGTGSAHGAIKVNPGEPGAMMGLLGDFDLEKMRKLSRHSIAFVVPHSAPNATIDFIWKNPEGRFDPFGGAAIFPAGSSTPFSITALTASAIDGPVPLDEEGFAQNFEALGGSDAVKAIEAMNHLVAAGHEILPHLKSKLERKADPNLEKKYAEALASMDDPAFEKRAAAAKTLTDLGNSVIPLAKKTLAEQAAGLSVETKSTLENLANRLEHGSAASADHIRANRVRRLLDTIGSQEAEALKANLPEPKVVVDPDIAQMVAALRGIIGGGIEMGFPVDGDPFAGEEDFEVPDGEWELAPDAGFLPTEPAPAELANPEPEADE